MQTNRISRLLPWLALGSGVTSAALWALMMRFCMDDRGLLKNWNFPGILLVLVSLSIPVAVILLTRNLGGSNRYRDNFGPSLPGCITCFAAAAGLLQMLLRNMTGQRNMLFALWLITGFLCVPALVLMGLSRLRGKRPHFFACLPLSIFIALHTAIRYRVWSGDPSSANYMLPFFACLFLLLNIYQNTAFSAGAGRRLRQLMYGLWAGYFAIACTFVPGFGLFYLSFGLWALGNLCYLTPRPRRRRPRPMEESPVPEAEQS